jgi:DNA-binding transcriptional MerR regulator/methylmalonyl-CoA mutase cobalamin-binding subunit
MKSMGAQEGLLRIGELSRRTGVKPDLLRAWERRYGLLEPQRTSGGFRLYPEAAVARVEAMRSHLAEGLSAAQAARMAAAAPAEPAMASIASLLEELRSALDGFDEPRAQSVLDRMLASFTLETVLSDAVIAYLHELGERWERGEASVAQEHFASSVIRGRLLGLARGWGAGSGPLALLACPPGEEHDLGLLTLGVVLHARGWRVAYLGPDTPMETLAQAAKNMRADWVVLAGLSAKRLRAVENEIADLSGEHRVALAGSGASADLAQKSGALFLPGGPVEEAKRLAGTIQPQRAH